MVVVGVGANNAKYSKNAISFSGLLRHSARNEMGLFYKYNAPEPPRGFRPVSISNFIKYSYNERKQRSRTLAPIGNGNKCPNCYFKNRLIKITNPVTNQLIN